ncbi:MAG: tRNA guanosine(34) transglycosylase Tgt [Candidatus Kerfeldbacteria bacterium]|nr:tRNA guanosine(34) transglycosylase Tgt [Candidatus Kerfeldbacteria bacterium]
MFTITHRWQQARSGQLHTDHGLVPTPAFMPIATRGSLKHLANSDLTTIGNDIILANTYHLFLRPGIKVLKQVGGLHQFMHWTKPILTDSGGYQVFSLARLRLVSPDGVRFNSHIDGHEFFFTPELAMDIQAAIGSDIRMCFDYFPGYPANRAQVEESVRLTTNWAERCRAVHSVETSRERSLLFGIVQGSTWPDLRARSASELRAIGFDGYAIGGLAVGEPPEIMYHVLDATVPLLPAEQPRYLMGVGQPEQILQAVKRGIDMFDCVLPTRNARHGQVYVHTASQLVEQNLSLVHYTKLSLDNLSYQTDSQPLDPLCDCSTCTSGYSRAYLRYLFSVHEPLAARLATVHNVSFYIQLLRDIRINLALY